MHAGCMAHAGPDSHGICTSVGPWWGGRLDRWLVSPELMPLCHMDKDKDKDKERDARFTLDLMKSVERSTKELKNVENDRRAAEIAAAEMRGRSTAEKEALLADKRAADARADKSMDCAAYWMAKFNSCKAEDARRDVDEAQEWKRRYEALEARMEAMLSVFTQLDIIGAVGGLSTLMATRPTANWQMAKGANWLKLGGVNIDLTGYCDADHGGIIDT